MTARNSPFRTAKSTPRSAETSTSPIRYIFRRSRISMIGPLSVIGQRFDRILARGLQPRVHGAKYGAYERDTGSDGPPVGHDGLGHGRHKRRDQPARAVGEDDPQDGADDG